MNKQLASTLLVAAIVALVGVIWHLEIKLSVLETRMNYFNGEPSADERYVARHAGISTTRPTLAVKETR